MSWHETPKSSAIKRFAYDHQSSTLTIHYKNGGLYDYHGVSHEAFEKFKAADSHGSHLAAHIAGKHKHTKRRK